MGELPEEYDDAWLDYLPPEAKLEWLRYGAEGANPPPEYSGVLPQLSDPELAGYMGLGSNDTRRKSLQGQLERGQALQQQGQGQYTSILGAALGGLGSLVNTGMGLHQQRKAQKGLDELTSSEQATRSRFARGAQSWDPAQAANLGILSGDPVLGAYGEAVQKQVQNADTRGLRGIGLAQARERLSLQKQESARKAATGKEKFDLDKWKAQQQVALGWKGLGLREQEAAQQDAGKGVKLEGELRREFNALPEVKEFGAFDANYQGLLKAAKNHNGIGGTTAIFSFMKLIDPGVAVMEGDVDRIKAAGGPAAQFAGLYERAISGAPIPKTVIDDMVKQAGELYGIRERQIRNLEKQYSGIAQQSGADPGRVVVPRGAGVPATGDIDLMQPPATRAAPQVSDQDRAAMQWLKSNPNDPRAAAVRKRLQDKGLSP